MFSTPRRLLTRFRRARDGAAAVEFALVAAPFFALLYAIIEVALMFFAGTLIESAVADVGRKIRTGQAQAANMTAATFKNEVCSGLLVFVDCGVNLYVDVKRYDDFTNSDPLPPIDPDTGRMRPMTFEMGGKGSIIVVRAYYAWPVLITRYPTNRMLVDGRRLLGGVVAFQNEPFPDAT